MYTSAFVIITYLMPKKPSFNSAALTLSNFIKEIPHILKMPITVIVYTVYTIHLIFL